MITTSTRTRLFSAILLLGCAAALQGQSSVLDQYIESGLKNNFVMQQKNISLEKAMYSLKTANSLFFPSINLKGEYQSGEGGRSISIPVGDMLNPVYTTLNQLTMSHAFPQISNSVTNFFPRNFYDAKVRTTMPILNSDLIYNHKIQSEQAQLQQYDVEVYKKELIKNIKVAYFNYLAATKSIGIYESAMKLANEGKRINESLLSNGKGVQAYVIRSESEIQNLDARRSAAEQQAKNAQLYFNFLINAEATQAIDTNYTGHVDQSLVEQSILSESSIGNRAELKMLDQAATISKHVVSMNKGYWYPRLNGYLDLGSQASDWKFNSQSRYYLVGFQLDIPIFAAGKNYFKVRQSELDLQNQLLTNSYTTRQMQLSANMAKNSLSVAYANYKAAVKQLESATVYYRLIDKGYKEGVNTFIETVDARNQLTSASLQLVLDQYQLFSAQATYDREISK